MTTIAHLPTLPDFDRRDDWNHTSSAGTFSDLGSSSECPFITNPSTSSSSSLSWRLPPGHPPVPLHLTRSRDAPDDRIGASNILPTLPALPSSPTVDSSEVVKGNFAHLYSQDLDLPSAAVQQQLKGFRAAAEGYATASYDSAFNWEDLRLPVDIHREWYCVVFRSRRHPSSSNVSLYSADRAAHYEAIDGGGLVMYWYGEPDSEGRNLATCIWQSRGQAVEATKGPKHLNAMRQASKAYESFSLERWVLRKEEGEEEVSVVPWQAGEVDFGSSVEA